MGLLAAAVYLPIVAGEEGSADPKMDLDRVTAAIQDLHDRQGCSMLVSSLTLEGCRTSTPAAVAAQSVALQGPGTCDPLAPSVLGNGGLKTTNRACADACFRGF